MTKTYQFRLYPTKRQQATLTRWLALCCQTYNAALQERRDAYRIAGKSFSYSLQSAELAEVHSQVLQDAVKRVDLAFDAFFRRCETGEHPGYPRFKSRFRYDSLTFKQYGNSFTLTSGSKRKGTLILSKIGHIKMAMHRPITGTPKTAIVKRTPTGKWFASLAVETDDATEPLPLSDEQVGIDVGLNTFAYLSRGVVTKVSAPHLNNP